TGNRDHPPLNGGLRKGSSQGTGSHQVRIDWAEPARAPRRALSHVDRTMVSVHLVDPGDDRLDGHHFFRIALPTTHALPVVSTSGWWPCPRRWEPSRFPQRSWVISSTNGTLFDEASVLRVCLNSIGLGSQPQQVVDSLTGLGVFFPFMFKSVEEFTS